MHDVSSVLAAQAPSTGTDKQATRASPENTAAANHAAPAAQPDQAPKDCTSAQAMRQAPRPEPQGDPAPAAGIAAAAAAADGRNDETVEPAAPSGCAIQAETPAGATAAAAAGACGRSDETTKPAEHSGGANIAEAAIRSAGQILRQRTTHHPPCSDEEADTPHGPKSRSRRQAAGGGGADAPQSAGTRSEPRDLRAAANAVPAASIRKTHHWDGQSKLWKAGARPYNEEQARSKTAKIASAVPREGNCFWEVMKRKTGTRHYRANKLETKKYQDEEYARESQEPGFRTRHDPDGFFHLPNHDDEEAMASVRHNLSTDGQHSDDTVMLLAALAHNAVIRISSIAAPRAAPHTTYNGSKQVVPPAHEIEMLLRPDRTEWLYDANFKTAAGRRSDGHFWSIEAASVDLPGNGRTSDPSRR